MKSKEAKILRKSWQERGDEITRLDQQIMDLKVELGDADMRWWSGWEMGYKCCLEDALRAVNDLWWADSYTVRYREALRKRLKRSLVRRQGRKGK